MKQQLTNLIDTITLAILGHSLSYRRWLKRRLRELQAEERLKERLCVIVVERVRKDLAEESSSLR